MNTIDIENMLKNHLENQSKLIFRQRDIDGLRERLYYGGCTFVESKDEAIEGLSIHAVTISDMPTSHTNNIHSTVETATLHYRDEMKNPDKLTDFEVRDIKRKIARIEEEVRQLNIVVDTVETWLKALHYEERFVVENRYIQSLKWPFVETFYFERFKEHRHIDRLQKIANTALLKMLNIAS